MLVRLFSLKTMVLTSEWVSTAFSSTPLFSMRTVIASVSTDLYSVVLVIGPKRRLRKAHCCDSSLLSSNSKPYCITCNSLPDSYFEYLRRRRRGLWRRACRCWWWVPAAARPVWRHARSTYCTGCAWFPAETEACRSPPPPYRTLLSWPVNQANML